MDDNACHGSVDVSSLIGRDSTLAARHHGLTWTDTKFGNSPLEGSVVNENNDVVTTCSVTCSTRIIE
jgi:hypothetical protein